MKGKRTYASLAAIVASVAIGWAARHGYDLGPLQGELVDALIVAFAGLAAFFRARAHHERR